MVLKIEEAVWLTEIPTTGISWDRTVHIQFIKLNPNRMVIKKMYMLFSENLSQLFRHITHKQRNEECLILVYCLKNID